MTCGWCREEKGDDHEMLDWNGEDSEIANFVNRGNFEV